MLGISACSGSKHGSVVYVTVKGSEVAFTDRSVQVEGKRAPPVGGAGPGVRGTTVGLCTDDRTRFLTAPVHIEILQGDETISTGTLDRVACQFEGTPGYVEQNFVFLEDDGSLLVTLDGSDSRVYAYCTGPHMALDCEMDEL